MPCPLQQLVLVLVPVLCHAPAVAPPDQPAEERLKRFRNGWPRPTDTRFLFTLCQLMIRTATAAVLGSMHKCCLQYGVDLPTRPAPARQLTSSGGVSPSSSSVPGGKSESYKSQQTSKSAGKSGCGQQSFGASLMGSPSVGAYQ